MAKHLKLRNMKHSLSLRACPSVYIIINVSEVHTTQENISYKHVNIHYVTCGGKR